MDYLLLTSYYLTLPSGRRENLYTKTWVEKKRKQQSESVGKKGARTIILAVLINLQDANRPFWVCPGDMMSFFSLEGQEEEDMDYIEFRRVETRWPAG